MRCFGDSINHSVIFTLGEKNVSENTKNPLELSHSSLETS